MRQYGCDTTLGLDQSARAQGWWDRRGRAGKEPQQIESASAGGVCVCCGQMAMVLYEGARSLGCGNRPHDLETLDQQLASFEGKSGILMAVHPVGFLYDPEVW